MSFPNLPSAIKALGPEECRAIFLVMGYFSGDADQAAKWMNTKSRTFGAKPISLLRRKPRAFLAWCEKNLTPINQNLNEGEK